MLVKVAEPIVGWLQQPCEVQMTVSFMKNSWSWWNNGYWNHKRGRAVCVVKKSKIKVEQSSKISCKTELTRISDFDCDSLSHQLYSLKIWRRTYFCIWLLTLIKWGCVFIITQIKQVVTVIFIISHFPSDEISFFFLVWIRLLKLVK